MSRASLATRGCPFRVSTTATLVAGTTFLTWLAWQITSRGLGSGVWLILIVPTLASLPQTVATLYEFQKQGIVPTAGVLWGAVFIIAAIAAAVALLLADGHTADTAPACAWSTVLAYSMLPWVVVPAGGHRAHLRIRRLGVVVRVRPSRAARRARAADLAVRCPLREILPPG